MCQSLDLLEQRGRNERIITTLVKLLKTKLGSLSEEIIAKINNSDKDRIEELTVRIFEVKNEEGKN